MKSLSMRKYFSLDLFLRNWASPSIKYCDSSKADGSFIASFSMSEFRKSKSRHKHWFLKTMHEIYLEGILI